MLLQQWDIVQLRAKPPIKYAIVLSGELYLDLPSLVVIPLIAAEFAKTSSPINPLFELEGSSYHLRTELIASVPKGAIGKSVGSVNEEALRVQNALDRLVSGY